MTQAMIAINDLTFGVELELFLPHGMSRGTAAARITEAGVACVETTYGHSTPTTWKIVTDGSLGDYSRGAEVVSPILRGEAGFDALRKVCNALVLMGATVHRSCGFHVHVGARGENVEFFKNLGRIYTQFENVIDGLLSASRRGSANLYCKAHRLDERALQSAIDVRGVARAIGAGYSGEDRYMKLNLAAWFRHGTVEFRHHQGTVDADKAINWVKLCLRMCVRAKQTTTASPAAITATTRASRDRWLATVVEMLVRPEGTTRGEVMARTGQRGARLPRRIAEAGLIVVKRRRAGEVRFYGRMPEAGTTEQPVISLDGLMAYVAATREEQSFFAGRAAALRR